jgi:hypothetical protein
MEDVEKEKFTRTQVNMEMLKEYVGGKVIFNFKFFYLTQ